jgi:alkanesulfonate monooxygenase SsuD/methylene tetrahydromethanopterin reductase-like flavin-dependent oxidoreductase (luciferase family)
VLAVLGLLRRLWREEGVTWSGRFRAPLTEPTTTTPRPFARDPYGRRPESAAINANRSSHAFAH